MQMGGLSLIYCRHANGCTRLDLLIFSAFAVMHMCMFNSVPMEHVSPELQVRTSDVIWSVIAVYHAFPLEENE